MNEKLHVVCATCLAVNRVPAERLRQSPKCGKCHQALFSGQPIALNQASFQKFLAGEDLPVVVDFWAPWCGPCKMMAPEFAQAARALEPEARLVKVDTQAEPALGTRFGIRSIPTLVLFRAGKELARHSGAIRADDIVRWVLGSIRQPETPG